MDVGESGLSFLWGVNTAMDKRRANWFVDIVPPSMVCVCVCRGLEGVWVNLCGVAIFLIIWGFKRRTTGTLDFSFLFRD